MIKRKSDLFRCRNVKDFVSLFLYLLLIKVIAKIIVATVFI